MRCVCGGEEVFSVEGKRLHSLTSQDEMFAIPMFSSILVVQIAPPSLGGKKVGVFATRSPHRPNPIGFSLVKLEGITLPTKANGKKFEIRVSGVDLVDNTPILDVKPYVPHYDSVGFYEYRSALKLCRSAASGDVDDVDSDVVDLAEYGTSLDLPEGELEPHVPDWLRIGLGRR